MNIPKVKYYPELRIDKGEILRYLGVRGELAEISMLLDSCLDEASSSFGGRAVYVELPLFFDEKSVKLGSLEADSISLKRHLEGCESAVIFAATVGIGIDRLTARYARSTPSRSVVFQAIGSERIESLADAFMNDISLEKKKNGIRATPRFSPGYGDLNIELQRDIFNILGCEKNIGLTLNESLLMSPTKSITAIFGLRKA